MILLKEIVHRIPQETAVADTEFIKEYDVIVCGMGTAGAYAALFCAQNGLSVLGIESHTCTGGNHTAGGIGGHYFGCPGGRYETLEEQIQAFAQRYTAKLPESRKLLMEQALADQKVDILYDSIACGIYFEEHTAVGLRVLSDGKLVNYGAKIILDCTADACIAAMAGCKLQHGRASDGQTQPYTLVSLTEAQGQYVFTNRDFGRVDPFDQWALAEAILFARSAKNEESQRTFVAQMPLPGIREGRRILSEETVRLEELFQDHQTQTPMFYSYSDLDKHGWDIAFDSATLGDWAVGANLGAYNITVAVPYKTILPQGIEGILVPCRALGVDRDLSSCVRMNLDMKKVAEAAAEWATLAIKQKLTLRNVPYAALREKLLQSGCLDEKYNRGYRIDGKKDWDGSPLKTQDVFWYTEPQELKDRLQTLSPGMAIWSAKRMGAAVLPTLRPLLDSSDETLKKHTAFAVASLGSEEATPILREMVLQRDGQMLLDCRKNNNLRGYMAIYWLGRLADRAITNELIRLICDPDEIKNPVYHQADIQTTRYKIAEYKDIYFQFISHAVMALIRIGDQHADLRPCIEQAFADAFATDDYYYRITTKPKMSSEGNMAQTIKLVAEQAIARWQA